MSQSTKNIKFYFYKVEKVFDVGLIREYSFESFFENKFSLEYQLLDFGDNKAFLEKLSDNVFSFQRIRKDFTALIIDEKTGEKKFLELRETEALLEEVFLYWDFKNNIIIFQSSKDGFKIDSFERYIKEIFRDKFNKQSDFRINHIMSSKGIERIIDSDVIKSFNIAVAKPNPVLLKNLGLSLDEIADFDLKNIETLELKISSKKKTSLFSAKTLKKMIKFETNKDKYKKLKIEASGSYFGGGQVVDLIDDFYSVIRKDVRVDEKTNNIPERDIILLLEDIYEKSIQEVLELV